MCSRSKKGYVFIELSCALVRCIAALLDFGGLSAEVNHAVGTFVLPGHGPWYYMVLYGTAWHGMALGRWYCLALDGIAW